MYLFIFIEGGARESAITNAIVYCIAKDGLPLNTTEHEGFKYLIKVLSPHFKLFGRKKLTQLVDAKFEVLSKLKKKELATVEYFALTCDAWSDTMTNRSYLGVTGHYLSSEGKPSSIILGLKELTERHTANYIKEVMRDTCLEWEIPKPKILVTITDGATNMIKAITDMFPSHRHIWCTAHKLNLVIEDVINENEDLTVLIEDLKKIVTFFKSSNNAARDLERFQNSETPLRLIQDVSIRWNSTFDLMERFLKLVEIVSKVLLKYPKGPDMIRGNQMALLQDAVQMLAPFKEATEELSGQKYVTISRIIPMMDCLKKEVSSIKPTTEGAVQLQLALLDHLSSRFDNLEKEPLIAMATILDPRFKKIYFQSALNAAQAVTQISNQLKQGCSSSEKPAGLSAQPPETKRTGLWSHHKKVVDAVKKCNDDSTSASHDLKAYLSSDTVPLEIDVLDYWMRQKENMPKLANIALKYLWIPATSVPSERLFSLIAQILTETRSRLTPEHLFRLLFLKFLSFEDWKL